MLAASAENGPLFIVLPNQGEGNMLILTRRVQEALIIGDDVTVTVLSIKGNQVRLGIDAPRHVEVHREEIYHRVKQTHQDQLAEPNGNR